MIWVHVGHVFYDLFWWPGGIVVGNLIASALWATPAFLRLRSKMNKQHEALKEHVAVHTAAQTEQLKTHITEVANAGQITGTIDQEA